MSVWYCRIGTLISPGCYCRIGSGSDKRRTCYRKLPWRLRQWSSDARFQVLTAAIMKITAFWDIEPCRPVVDRDRCLLPPSSGRWVTALRQEAHLNRRSASTRLHGAVSQKAVILILWSVGNRLQVVTTQWTAVWSRTAVNTTHVTALPVRWSFQFASEWRSYLSLQYVTVLHHRWSLQHVLQP
jgi:hypothetical protein